MTREEFVKELEPYAPLNTPTPEEYKVIEKVYQWYPTISETKGKTQVAHLYATFGMVIFHDMAPTADMAARLESDIRDTKRELSNLLDQYEDLKRGLY